MHTLLGLSSLLLVLVGGHLALGLVRRLGDWSRRRDLQVLVLAAPMVSLGVGIGALHHFAGSICFLGAPPWDYTVGVALPLGMGLLALGALALGVARLALLERVVARRTQPAGGELQALVDGLAGQVGAARPRMLLCAYDRPLALTCGLWRPKLLLSTWMLDHLDQRELESVLAHELAHVRRRDFPLTWLATVLRDACFYLPTSWAAYRQLQREQELACDELAVAATNRPLALASALAKVWQQTTGGLSFAAAQALTEAGERIEARIQRLLVTTAERRQPTAVEPDAGTAEGRAGAPPEVGRPSSVGVGSDGRRSAVWVGSTTLAGLLVLEAANAAVFLTPMGCGPLSLLAKLV